MLELREDPRTVDHERPLYDVGGTYYWAGRYFRYFKFVDAVTYAAGHSVAHASANGTAVSNDRSGGSSIGDVPAGVCLRAMTQNHYGFVQVSGWGLVPLLTDGGVVAGDALVLHTVDGQVDTMADTEENEVFAWALADDDSSGYVAAGSYFIQGIL